MWTKIGEEEHEQKKKDKPDFTRHSNYKSYIIRISFGTYPTEQELEERLDKAPETPAINNYKLNFGQSTNLEFSENTKLVEAHMSQHATKSRVTLLYKGLAAFTFQLREAKKLQEASDWFGTYTDPSSNLLYEFHVNLKFSFDRLSASG